MAARTELRLQTARTAWFAWTVVMLTGVGGAVRLSGLTDRELWLDEACTYYYVHHLPDWPLVDTPRRLEIHNFPYVGGLWLWTRAWGESVVALRSFSVLAGTATIPLIMLLGRRLNGSSVGVVAGIITVFHPLHVHYSQEARAYAVWCLVMTLALFALLMALRSASVRWWWGWALAAIGAVATHYYALLAFPAQCLTAVSGGFREGRRWPGWVAMAVVAVLLIPLVWSLVLPVTDRGSADWLAEVWASYSPIPAPFRSLWAMMPAGGYPADYLQPTAGAALRVEQQLGMPVAGMIAWGPTVVVLMCLLGWWGRVRRVLVLRRGQIEASAQAVEDQTAAPEFSAEASVRCLAIFMAAFLGTAWLYSLCVRPAYVVGRYDLPAWPAVVLLCALAVKNGSQAITGEIKMQRWLMVIIAGVLALCGAATIYGTRLAPRSGEMSRQAWVLAEWVAPGETVVSVGLYRWFLCYESDKSGFGGVFRSFPPWHDEQIGWRNPSRELSNLPVAHAAAERMAGQIEIEMHSGKRVWVVVNSDPVRAEFAVDRLIFDELAARGITPVLRDGDWLAELVRLSE